MTIRNWNLIALIALFLTALISGKAVGLCGDADDDGSLGISDPVYTLSWLLGTGPAPPNFGMADADGYDVLTIRDVGYLLDYFFGFGAAPTCPPSQPRFIPAVDPGLNVTYSTTYPPSSTSEDIEIFFNTANSLTYWTISLPFDVTVGGTNPVSLSFVDDGDLAVEYAVNVAGGPSGNLLVLGFTSGTTAAGTYKLGTLTIDMAADPSPRTIDLAYTMLPPLQGGVMANEPMISDSAPVKGANSLAAAVPLINGESPCGDANSDGSVSIVDAVYVINYIFGGGPAPNVLFAADTNCNGNVSISDAVFIINYIFGGGPAPCANC